MALKGFLESQRLPTFRVAQRPVRMLAVGLTAYSDVFRHHYIQSVPRV
jgi:hypothetical protein